MTHTHRSVLPCAVHNRLIVQGATHVSRVLPRVDVDHVPAPTPAATTVVGTPEGLVPVPAEIEKLSCDVPVAHLGAATEVAGNAVDPVTRT